MKRVAIYARLSKATEESVSIERQVESCTSYATARGWAVALVATDDGVSATKNKPEDRDGWRQILAAAEDVDVVLVWKVDRLARSVLDFLHADEALQKSGAALAAVEDPVDMSTAQGRAFATLLAVFGQMEADAIRARTTAARRHLTREGRVVGGDLPWFLTKVPNPDGAGFVPRPIPERAAAVRDAADWILSGVSLLEVCRRWDAAGLATAGKVKTDKDGNKPKPKPWSISSLRSVLTNPALYGATVVSTRDKSGNRVPDVLRGADGLPKIDAARAILDRGTFLRLQEALNSRSRGPRPSNLPLLYALATCASCGSRMVGHRRKGKEDYECQNRTCTARVAVQMERLDAYAVGEVLDRFGSLPRLLEETVDETADPVEVAALQAEIADLSDAISSALDADDYAAVADLNSRRKALQSDLDALFERPARRVSRFIDTGETVADAYAAADTTEARRDVLATYVGAVLVRRGKGQPIEARARIVERVDPEVRWAPGSLSREFPAPDAV